MLTYIKTSNPTKNFLDDTLGLYLDKNNAAQVNSSIIHNRLINFISTGYLVEISKLEYDNIQIKFGIARNIPLNVVEISKSSILNPVEDIIINPPIANNFGERYLIGLKGGGQFSNKGDYIAEWTKLGWVYTKPEDGMLLPVYSLGTSITYQGFYPSGKWDISDEKLTLLKDVFPGPLTSQEYALKLFQQEQKSREDADILILKAITDFNNALSSLKIKASNVSVADVKNIFVSNNVEGALTELRNLMSGYDDKFGVIDRAFINFNNSLNDIYQRFVDLSNRKSEIWFGVYLPQSQWDLDINNNPINPYRIEYVVVQDSIIFIAKIDYPTLIPNEDNTNLEWAKIGDNNKVAEAWTVYGLVSFGKYAPGSEVPEAESSYAQIKEAFQNILPPVYYAPTLTNGVSSKINSNNADINLNSIEVGQEIKFNINPQFTQNDSGGIDYIDANNTGTFVYGNENNVSDNLISKATPKEQIVTLTPIPYKIKTTINYLAGPIKDNPITLLPDGRGKIEAGSISSEITINPRYKIFYGNIDSVLNVDSSLIRAGNSRWENDPNIFILNTGNVNKKFFVAIRKSLVKIVSDVKDLSASNAPLTTQYTNGLQEVSIKDGGVNDIIYKVFIMESASPYSTNHEHQITINNG